MAPHAGEAFFLYVRPLEDLNSSPHLCGEGRRAISNAQLQELIAGRRSTEVAIELISILAVGIHVPQLRKDAEIVCLVVVKDPR